MRPSPRTASTPFLFACISLFASCTDAPSNRIQGYIEGEFIYIASPLSGELESLTVQRGTQVKKDDPLFQLESTSELAALDEAKGRLAQAKADLEDTRKGKRPSELESLDAQLRQARAALELAKLELERQVTLSKSGATPSADLDRARSANDQRTAEVAQLEADLTTARLGSRDDEITSAEEEVKARAAALAKAQWDLDQKKQSATHAGAVFDTLYREGEWVPAGRPVVVILPPPNVKLRAFASQELAATIHAGDPVKVFVDGVAEPITGRVTFVSPQVEYTPPVIYSKESREKLMMMIEARFDDASSARLHPGQPVDVSFER